MTRHILAVGFVAATVAAGIGAARAADLPARLPAPAMVTAPYSWTGFYLGGNVGYATSENRTRDIISAAGGTLGPAFDMVPHGVVGGGQVGYNWQTGSWVLGIEADIQASGARSATNCVLTCTSGTLLLATQQELPWFGTVRGRLGTAVGGLLFYYTAGLAYGEVETRFTGNFPGSVGTVTFDQNRVGWTLGSGVEADLGGNWTGRLEYLYIDLGKASGNYVFAGTPHSFISEPEQHIVRVAANYRFGVTGSSSAMAVPRWAGLYAGGNLGNGVARNTAAHFIGAPLGPLTETFDVAPSGILGGLQVGYNWQAANWVYGLEADIQGSAQESQQTCGISCVPLSVTQIKQELPWFGTVRGRLGYSVGPALFYATGGLAYGEVKNTINETVGAFAPASVSLKQTKSGYTVGAGIETPMYPIFGWAFPNWSIRTEYLYVDLGTVTDNYTYGGAPHTLTTQVRNNIFRTSLNYQFGPH